MSPCPTCRFRSGGAGEVVADLHVFEGQSHAQYAGDPEASETKEHFGELSAFFDKYLAR